MKICVTLFFCLGLMDKNILNNLSDNGIEYADMQIICEDYHILNSGLGLGANDMVEQWLT